MTVAVIEKAFLLLETLAQAREPMPLKDITERVKLPKPTAYRLLQTLQKLGYVVRPGDSREYLLGHRIRQLSGGPLHQQLKEAARPLIERLHKTVLETVNLGVREGTEIRYVDYLETTRPLRLIVRPGQTDSLFSTALGRAILAAHPEEEAAAWIATDRAALPRPADAAALRTVLERTRKRGWAEEREETVPGVCCLAVSLKKLGFVDAAISVSIPTARFTPPCQKAIERIFDRFLYSHAKTAKPKASLSA